MGKTYDFDKAVDRRKTSCLKYDFGMKRKGRDDLLPLWVADMDFQLPEEILADFRARIDHGILATRIRTRNTMMRWITGSSHVMAIMWIRKR